MAIDTRQKRRSMMNRTMPWRSENIPATFGLSTELYKHQRMYRYAMTWLEVVPPVIGALIIYNELFSELVLQSEVFGNIRCTSEVE